MLTLLWMSVAQAAPDWMPGLEDAWPPKLPDWVEVGGMYDTEPMLILAYPYANYVHGLEANVRMGTGLSKDVSEWEEKDHWSLYGHFHQFSDTGDLGAIMGVVQSPQEIYNPRGVYLGELALRRDPGDGWLYVRLGSISADMDFVAPDAAALYVHSAFNNQYNISMEQFPISPFSSLGAVVGAPLSDTVEVKTGVYQLSRFRTNETIRGWRWDLNRNNGVVGFFQVNASFEDIEPTSNLPQTGWQFGTFLSRDEASMNREPSHGVYGNATVALSQHSIAWVSVNHSLHPAVNPVPLWVAGGWISEAHWFDRPQDLVVTGLSYSQYSFVDPYAFETMLEVEYHYAATDWLTLLPNIQYFAYTPIPNGVFPVTAGVGIIAER